jgi:hypothetical protein
MEPLINLVDMLVKALEWVMGLAIVLGLVLSIIK